LSDAAEVAVFANGFVTFAGRGAPEEVAEACPNGEGLSDAEEVAVLVKGLVKFEGGGSNGEEVEARPNGEGLSDAADAPKGFLPDTEAFSEAAAVLLPNGETEAGVPKGEAEDADAAPNGEGDGAAGAPNGDAAGLAWAIPNPPIGLGADAVALEFDAVK
jgi:hypothetical protein